MRKAGDEQDRPRAQDKNLHAGQPDFPFLLVSSPIRSAILSKPLASGSPVRMYATAYTTR